MRVPNRLAAVLTAVAPAIACLAQPVWAQGFGRGVAVSSDQVLIAESGGPTSTGVVYVYEKGPDGWTISTELAPYAAEEGGSFGTSLSVDGDRMLVGAPGAAYVFERNGDAWEEVAALRPADLPEGVGFGAIGAIAGDVAFVTAMGQPSRQNPGGGAAGRVYVFERGDSGWTEAGSIASPEAAEGDRFGTAILTDGGSAAIGAPGASVGSANRAGAVYFFSRGDDGAWTAAPEALTAPDASENAGFGGTLAGEDTESGFRLLVGAAGAGGVGIAYAFMADGDTWTPAGRLFPPVVGGGGGGRFGGGGGFATAFASVGDELWIGGSGVGTGREGQVLRYAGNEGGLALAGLIDASNRASGDGFGSAVAADGDVAVIVAGGKDYRMGTAYIFERRGDEWVETAEVWSDAQNYAAVNGHEVGCEEGVSADFDCSEVNILSFMPVHTLGANRGTRVNDVWGWTDPQTGREYALVGLTDQASFVDITDAENPRYVGRLPMTEGARGSVWRDIKVFEDHAFIVSDGAGEHGMQVFDLTRLRDVGAEPVTFEVDAHYDGIASAHNIVINEETGFAYSVGSSGGGETCGGGLHMIDINEPTEPTFAGCFGHEGTGRRGTGYSHDALCLIYDGPDREHAGKEICFGSNETDVSIADVTDKENPIPLSSATYPSVAYAHQGWVTEDHRFFYLGDELDEIVTPFEGTRTMIFDITDLDDPVLVREHFGESTASDHNLYIVDDLMYQSNYNSGLRILDVSDPENPTEVGFIDTVPYAEGPSMGGSWSNYPYFASGTIIVTSGNEGLFMVKYERPVLVP
ncbi:choice-of-anchor B family protein [Candidatus Palauibacter sp.]|uniref:choice-of-anchor B family protein n=1 Tax=Candidatus Palauibacter sp. TaxID=3101350 RepID=UPI003B023C92